MFVIVVSKNNRKPQTVRNIEITDCNRKVFQCLFVLPDFRRYVKLFSLDQYLFKLEMDDKCCVFRFLLKPQYRSFFNTCSSHLAGYTETNIYSCQML